MTTRRGLLAGTASASAAGILAGCLGWLGGGDDDVGLVAPQVANTDLRRITSVPEDVTFGVTTQVQYFDARLTSDSFLVNRTLRRAPLTWVHDEETLHAGFDAFDAVDEYVWVWHRATRPTTFDVAYVVLSGSLDADSFRDHVSTGRTPSERADFELYAEDDRAVVGLSSDRVLFLSRSELRERAYKYGPGQPADCAARRATGSVRLPDWNREFFDAIGSVRSAQVKMTARYPPPDPPTVTNVVVRAARTSTEHVHAWAYPQAEDLDPLATDLHDEVVDELPASRLRYEDVGDRHVVIRHEIPHH